MKILFLVPGFEPGRDGVGDYTRRLCGEIQSLNAEPALAALADSTFSENNKPLPTLRLNKADQPTRNRDRLASFIQAFRPEAVSFQMVAYGYHPRADLSELANWLREAPLPPRRHLMVHEIWIGAARTAPWREKARGWLQRRNLMRFIKSFQPGIIHTHAEPYLACLARAGIPAKKLPLFPNIPPIAARDAPSDLSKATIDIGVFSGLPGELNVKELLAKLDQAVAQAGKRARLRFFGRGQEALHSILNTHAQPNLAIEVLGELSSEEVSRVMLRTDLAIGGAPLSLWEKSSVIASWRAHGVPVWLPRNDVCFIQGEPELPPGLIGGWDGLRTYMATGHEPAKSPPGVEDTAKALLKALR